MVVLRKITVCSSNMSKINFDQLFMAGLFCVKKQVYKNKSLLYS